MEKCKVDPTRDCIGLSAVEDLKKDVIVMKEQIKTLKEWRDGSKQFHNDFYDWQREQLVFSTELTATLNSMKSDLSSVLSWQDEQKEKPVRLFDSILKEIILVIVGGVISYFLFT